MYLYSKVRSAEQVLHVVVVFEPRRFEPVTDKITFSGLAVVTFEASKFFSYIRIELHGVAGQRHQQWQFAYPQAKQGHLTTHLAFLRQ